MFYSSIFNIYKQSVKTITLTSGTMGGIYGIALYNGNSNQTFTKTVGKYTGFGLLCGVAYPLSIPFYTIQLVKECINNPYSKSSDTPIL